MFWDKRQSTRNGFKPVSQPKPTAVDLVDQARDIIASAFAANVEEIFQAIVKKIPATKPYMDIIRASQAAFDTFDFPNDAARAYVNDARDMKALVTHAADTLLEVPLLEAYDSKPQSEKRKTQHFYSDIINRFRAKEIGENLKDNGSRWENARFHSNDGSMAGAWLFNVPTHRQLTMSTTEFRSALKIRLVGADFHSLPSHCYAAARPRRK